MPSKREQYTVRVEITVLSNAGAPNAKREVVAWRQESPAVAFETATDMHGYMVGAINWWFRFMGFGRALFDTAQRARDAQGK